MVISPSNPFSRLALFPIAEESDDSDAHCDHDEIDSGYQEEKDIQAEEEYEIEVSETETATSTADNHSSTHSEEAADSDQTVLTSNSDNADGPGRDCVLPNSDMAPEPHRSTEQFSVPSNVFQILTEQPSPDQVEELDYYDSEDPQTSNERTGSVAERALPSAEYEHFVQEVAPSLVTSTTNTTQVLDSGSPTTLVLEPVSPVAQQSSSRNFSSFADLINIYKKTNSETTTAKKPEVKFNPMASEFTPSFTAPLAVLLDEDVLHERQDMVAPLGPQTQEPSEHMSIKDAAQAEQLPDNPVKAPSPSPIPVQAQADVRKQVRPPSSIFNSKWAPRNTSAVPQASRAKTQPQSPQMSSDGTQAEHAEQPRNDRRGGRHNRRGHCGSRFQGDGEHSGWSRRGRGRPY